MADKTWVDDKHYRVVSDDGRTSRLYEADGGLFHRDTCVEVADHREDGTTKAYEPDDSFIGVFLHGGKGKEK